MSGLFNNYFHGLLTGWRPLVICVGLLVFSGLYFPPGNQDSLATYAVDDFDTSSIAQNMNDDSPEHLVLLRE